jgi:hypothetical protein
MAQQQHKETGDNKESAKCRESPKEWRAVNNGFFASFSKKIVF